MRSPATPAALKRDAEYERVGLGDTGHAESVQITYDPKQVSYGRLLQIFFSVAHDPTQLNRQGPDSGTQYRSAIFPLNADQARVAKAYIDQLNEARAFDKKIATKIEMDRPFYPAEALSPGFPHAESALPVHRHQRPAEDRRAEARVPGCVSRRTRAGQRVPVSL